MNSHSRPFTALLAGTVSVIAALNAYHSPKLWQKVLWGLVAGLEFGEARAEWTGQQYDRRAS